jgi:cytochrome c biogenesis protein CcmG, thiol:disulfide interchange protein DsbE
MNATSATRSAVASAGRLLGRHKVISAVVALFAAAVIAVSLATTGTAAPRQYPAAHGFTLPALDHPDQKVSLSQYQGKPVIVNFFASWCEPCQRETPLLASWYTQQHGHVAMLGLDENDVTANALKFDQAKGVSYPVGFDPNLTVPSAYGVNGLPQTFFLNARHRIVDHVLGAVTKADLAKGVRLMNTAG